MKNALFKISKIKYDKKPVKNTFSTDFLFLNTDWILLGKELPSHSFVGCGGSGGRRYHYQRICKLTTAGWFDNFAFILSGFLYTH